MCCKRGVLLARKMVLIFDMMMYKSFSPVGFSSCPRRFSSKIIVKMRFFVAIISLAFVFPAMGATYYIDYSIGLDANGGASTSGPWERHPYMQGFSGSYSHFAGNQFIFKGGLTWPATSSPADIEVQHQLTAREQFWWGFFGGCLLLGFRVWTLVANLPKTARRPHFNFRNTLIVFLGICFVIASGLMSQILDPHYPLMAVFEGASGLTIFLLLSKEFQLWKSSSFRP